MTLSLMPKDLPLPIDAQNNGITTGTTGQVPSRTGPDGITAWDPWTHANLALMADKSQPEIGNDYGEVTYYQTPTIVSEWGGMPSPVAPFQDIGGDVLIAPRMAKNFSGPTGQFMGPAQTAWEATYQDPTSDYYSVILGG